MPGYPHHIVQRGHNRQVVFAERRDFERYVDTLATFKDVYGIKVYAYCLMTNHVHLLLAPETIAGLGQLMKRLAGGQTRYHNTLEGRSGTLWESRYKSSPVDTDDYLLACARYIDLNPVRAKMTTQPEDYPWSSCRHRIGVSTCDWLDHDPCYLALGTADIQRQRRYRQLPKRCAMPSLIVTSPGNVSACLYCIGLHSAAVVKTRGSCMWRLLRALGKVLIARRKKKRAQIVTPYRDAADATFSF